MKYDGWRSADPRKDEKRSYIAIVIIAFVLMVLFIVKYFPGW